jgi:hypothetical protein
MGRRANPPRIRPDKHLPERLNSPLSYSGAKLPDKMKERRRKNDNRGMTLLITMMVLMLLATVIVQFQSDASLQLRADGYRRDQLQCRYAAESALISTPMLIKDVLEKASQAAQQAESGTVTKPEAKPAVDKTADPNSLADPNGPPKPKAWPFVVAERTLTVGEAKVEIKVHDETAKWPLLWLFRSPFDASLGDIADVQRCFIRYGEMMKLESDKTEKIMTLAKRMGEGLDLPKADFAMRKASAPKTTDGSTPPTTFRARWQRKNFAQRSGDLQKRKTLMSTFAKRWLEACRIETDYDWLKKPLKEGAESLTDDLGLWGSDRININLATVETLTSAFEPLGLTEEMAWAIVRQREQKSFQQVGALSEVQDVPQNVIQSIQSLCITAGDTYSVHVTARLGRAQVSLIGGLFIDDRQQFQVAAAIEGE